MSTMDSQSYSSSVGGVDPATTALICLGFQNETMKPGGVFYESVQPVLTKTHTLLNTEKLQKEALKRGYEQVAGLAVICIYLCAQVYAYVYVLTWCICSMRA